MAGGGLELADMREVSPGRYVSEKRIPVSGAWKSMLRLHRGGEMMAIALHLPADPELNKPELVATSRTMAFQPEPKYLLREQHAGNNLFKNGVYTLLAGVVVMWIAAFARRRQDRPSRRPAGAAHQCTTNERKTGRRLTVPRRYCRDGKYTYTLHNPFEFTDEEIAQAVVLSNALQAEALPEDPPTPLEQAIAQFRNMPERLRRTSVRAWSPDGEYIGGTGIRIDPDHDDNPDMLFGSVNVRADHRRHGVGTQLLAYFVALAQREGPHAPRRQHQRPAPRRRVRRAHRC